MSAATFTPVNITTVKDTYSWDDGTPLIDIGPSDLLINETELILSSANVAGIQYLGRSPFAIVALSSTITPNPSAVATTRIVDFGDYYNSESNLVKIDTLSAEYFCHTYVMPGVYTVKMTVIEYVKLKDVNTNLPLNSTQIYFQPTELANELPIFWQWCNYQCSNSLASINLRNKAVSWAEAEFQEDRQFTWTESTGPCVTVPTQMTMWNWDEQKCSSTSISLSWQTMECESCISKTWDEITSSKFELGCVETPFVIVPLTTEYVLENLVKVVEIPPKAFLEVQQNSNPNNRISPHLVTLSPKYVRCGSFPIEKIEWNLGDGTEKLTQRRWSVNRDTRFTENFEYEVDWKDPRNFDIKHVYNRTPKSGAAFYPSLTCYASSTSTSDCASGLVGPLKLGDSVVEDGESTVTFLQNELTDYGRILIGEVNDTLAIWRYNK